VELNDDTKHLCSIDSFAPNNEIITQNVGLFIKFDSRPVLSMVSTGTKVLLSLSSIALGAIMFIGVIRSSGVYGTPNGGAIFGSFCFILIGLVSIGIMMFNGIMSSKLVQQNQIISRGKPILPSYLHKR
jgi:hypothetical protein